MARPTKLTMHVQDTICEALREGASLIDACACVGIGAALQDAETRAQNEVRQS